MLNASRLDMRGPLRLAIAGLLAGPAPTAQAAPPNAVEPFESHTWSDLQAELKQPAAVVFTTAAGLKRSVSVDAATGRIKIAVYGLSLPLPAIDDGLLATVHLQPRGDQPLAGLSLVDAALGSDAGRNTPVEVQVSGADVKPLIYLPAILH